MSVPATIHPEGNDTALVVMNRYPPDQYNLLIPVETIQPVSSLHKLVVNVVRLNPDPAAGDVYEQRAGKFALTKKALRNFQTAANIQTLDSRNVLPQKCERCRDIAAQTRQAPRCGDCPSANDVAHQVTLAVPEPSGTGWRIIKATREIRMVDEQARMKPDQFKEFFPFRSEHCESKAMNRALRDALGLKATYTAEELRKPFVIGYMALNLDDPEIHKAVAQRAAGAIAELYGTSREIPQLTAGAAVTEIPADEPDEEDVPARAAAATPVAPVVGPVSQPQPALPGDTPPWLQTEQPAPPSTSASKDPNAIYCQNCGQLIMATDKWTPQAIRDYSQKAFGQVLCPECQMAAKKSRGGGRR